MVNFFFAYFDNFKLIRYNLKIYFIQKKKKYLYLKI